MLLRIHLKEGDSAPKPAHSGAPKWPLQGLGKMGVVGNLTPNVWGLRTLVELSLSWTCPVAYFVLVLLYTISKPRVVSLGDPCVTCPAFVQPASSPGLAKAFDLFGLVIVGLLICLQPGR